ncbi:hypothetical protein [Mesoterricola sediminis]|uniref:Uncharacterized protein n=1 Tax=Mesoterricola sediminis TaxID=2927980 RepID=A0AA48H624_9BACT|nr:hypothetical protein [Mesoterricola sediminis]BDU78046.1 hypothetical protein METESE_30040 [Mesoterricola sediminis]
MSKPDPSITAGLLGKLPTQKTETHAETHVPTLTKASVLGPRGTKPSARSAEKSSVQGHTRSSNRGK